MFRATINQANDSKEDSNFALPTVNYDSLTLKHRHHPLLLKCFLLYVKAFLTQIQQDLLAGVNGRCYPADIMIMTYIAQERNLSAAGGASAGAG